MNRSIPIFVLLCAASAAWSSEKTEEYTGFREPLSQHHAEWLAHRDDPPHPDLNNGQVILPRQGATSPAVCRTIFGYLPYWESPANIQWDKLTHLGAFSVSVNSAGDVTSQPGWPWTSVVNTAHANGVKVHLVVTLFDGPAITTLINSATNKANFFQNMRDLMIAGNFDGINIDFESGTTWQADMDEFMGELSAYMYAEIPGSETSIATAAVNWGDRWQFGNLVQNCDIIFIMGYNYWYSGSSTSGPIAPLAGTSISITDTVVNEYASARAIAPEKIVLGLPYYGLHWTTAGSAAFSSTLSFVESPRFRDSEPDSQFYGLLWDTGTSSPWYRYQVGPTWHQVWFENADSLRLKYELAEDYDLGGVGMWALNYDGTRTELWDLIQEEFVDICCEEDPPNQLVFSETFDDGAAAGRWDLHTSSADYTADYDYDYSAVGIPSAPNSTGGSTQGLKFTVNNNDAIASAEAVSTYPASATFTGDFALKFDMWLSYGAGAGSTEFMTAGIGHDGGKVVWPNSGSSDGNYFVVTGEGGASEDYRAYLGVNMYQIVNGVYSASSLNHTDGFYQAVFPDPPFDTGGAPGKRWVEVEISRANGVITWSIDGTILAAPPALSTGDKIMLGYTDIFTSIANPAADNFVIYDNVRVELLAESDCNGNGTADSCETITDGDFDANGAVDDADLAAFVDCLAGTGATPQPPLATCGGTCLSAFDDDGDFDIDLADFSAFQMNYTGP